MPPPVPFRPRRPLARFLACAASLTAAATVASLAPDLPNSSLLSSLAPSAAANTYSVNVNFGSTYITLDGAGAVPVPAAAWNQTDQFVAVARSSVAPSVWNGDILTPAPSGVAMTWTGKTAGTNGRTLTNDNLATKQLLSSGFSNAANGKTTHSATIFNISDLLPDLSTAKSANLYIYYAAIGNGLQYLLPQRVNGVWFEGHTAPGTRRVTDNWDANTLYQLSGMAGSLGDTSNPTEGKGGNYLKIDLIANSDLFSGTYIEQLDFRTGVNTASYEIALVGFQLVWETAENIWKGGNNTWSAANWATAKDPATPAPFVPDSTAIFDNSSGSGYTVTLDAPTPVEHIDVRTGTTVTIAQTATGAFTAPPLLTIAENATLHVAFDTAIGKLTGNGNLSVVSGTTTTLTSARSTYTGGFDIANNATLRVTGDATLGAATATTPLNFFGANATLEIARDPTALSGAPSPALAIQRAFTGTGKVNVASGSLSYSGTAASSITFNVGSYAAAAPAGGAGLPAAGQGQAAPAPSAPASAPQTGLPVQPSTSQQLTPLLPLPQAALTIATGANIAGPIRAGAATVTLEPGSTTANLLLTNHSTLRTSADVSVGTLTLNSTTDPADSTLWELSGTGKLSTNSLTLNGASVVIDIGKIYGSLAVGTYTLLQSTTPITNNTGADFRLTSLPMSADVALAQTAENITLSVNSTGYNRYIRTDPATGSFTDTSHWTTDTNYVNKAALTGDIFLFRNTTPVKLLLAPDYTLRLVGNVAVNFHFNQGWSTGPNTGTSTWTSPGGEPVGDQIVGLYVAGAGAANTGTVMIFGGTIDTGTHGADPATSYAILVRSNSSPLLIRSKIIGSGSIARLHTGSAESPAYGLTIQGDLSEYTGTIYGAGGARGVTFGHGAVIGSSATVALTSGAYTNGSITFTGDVDYGAKTIKGSGTINFTPPGYVVRLTGTDPGWLSSSDITWNSGGTIAINDWRNVGGKSFYLTGMASTLQLYGEDGTVINSNSGTVIQLGITGAQIKVGTADPRNDLLDPVTITYGGTLNGSFELYKTGKGRLVLTVRPSYTAHTRILEGELELTSTAMVSLGTSTRGIILIRPDTALIFNGASLNLDNHIYGQGKVVKKADGVANTAATNSLNFSKNMTFSGGLYIEGGRLGSSSGLGGGNVYVSNGGKLWLNRANADWTNNIFITGPGVPEPNGVTYGAIRVDQAATVKISGNITVVADPEANIYFSRINSCGTTGLRISGNLIGAEDVTLEFGETSTVDDDAKNHLIYLTGKNTDWRGTLIVRGEIGMSVSIGDGGNNGNLPNTKAIIVTPGGKLIANTARSAEANGMTLATDADLIIGGNISGGGNFEKQGAGTAILTGVASDLGAGTITVSAGSLFITGGIKAASASVSSGAVLGVADGGTIIGTVNIPAGAIFSSGLGIVTGNLNFTGASTVRTTAVGEYTIATGGTRSAKVTFDLGPLYTSLAERLIEHGETGARNIALLGYGSTLNGALPTTDWDVSNSGTYRPTSTPTLSATNGLIKLDLAATPHVLSWDSGNWDNSGTATWKVETSGGTLNVGDNTRFYTGDAAYFTDQGSATAAVNITAAVFPSAVIVNNSTATAYTFSGSPISGTGTKLIKEGTGTLTLSAANNYTGGTVVRSVPDGSTNSLILTNASALGQGPITLGNNALLDLSGAAADTNATTSGVRNAIIVNAPDVATVVMDKKDYEVNTLFVGNGVVKLSAGATVSSGSATDASHIEFYTSSPDFTGEIHLSTWTVLYMQAPDGDFRNTDFYLDGNFPVANRNDYRFSLKANTSVDTIYLGGSGCISFDNFTLFAKGIVRLDNPAFSTIGTKDGAVPNGTVPNARLSSSSPDGRLILGNYDRDAPLWIDIVIGNASTDYANADSYGKSVWIVKEGPGVVNITQAPVIRGGYIINEGILVYGSKASGRPTTNVANATTIAGWTDARIIVNPKGELWSNLYFNSNTADIHPVTFTAVLVGDNQNSGILGTNTYTRISDITLNGGTLYGVGTYTGTNWGTWQIRDKLVVTADQLDPAKGLPLLDPVTGEKLRAIDPQTGLPFSKENPLISYIKSEKVSGGLEGIRMGYRLSVGDGLFVFQVEEAAKLIISATVRDDGNATPNSYATGIRKTGTGELVLGPGNGFTIEGGSSTTSVYRGPTYVEGGRLTIGRVIRGSQLVAMPDTELAFTDGFLFGVEPPFIEIQSNAKLILDFASPWELNVASPIEGAGDIVKTGAGTVTLSTTVYLFGAAEINAGKFSIGAAGDLANISEVTLTGDTAIFEPLKNYG
ncbi:MAG: autotransporter-associated beta strand repeat-containing protein, partial [Puniceicoccales bacterium]|nr:autotransporter-associated beta strand repeat-containing protein [Puniceicoccales bacterium]